MKDCGNCIHKEDRLYTFSDGEVHLFFWCKRYGKPCVYAIDDCKKKIERSNIGIIWE